MPPIQTACDKMHYQEIRANAERRANTPIAFALTEQNGMEYVDLQKNEIVCKV